MHLCLTIWLIEFILIYSINYDQPFVVYERLIKMPKIAIYARKSVYKEDSISIESQVEFCAYEARGEEYSLYKDNGYSGKNTQRPDFIKMMEDIKSHKINKVIVYRLDRISRSILDFAEMMDLFKKYNVDFVSATEHFDTSSPMGRAMLNICIVFAQLERETIQQRVTDAYASRSKKGYYMGGKIPYGYKKIPTVIDGIKTSMYEIEPIEAEDIKLIYNEYSKPSSTLGDVLKKLNESGSVPNKRGKYWSTARMSEMIRNPAYTVADYNIYQFFREQGTNICNSPEEFDGEHSCYLFKGENNNRKTWDLSNHNLVIAPHKGIISSELWLACRRKLLANKKIRCVKPKNSFLAGKVKCGCCGYGLVIRQSQRKKTNTVRYFVDIGRSEMHICRQKLPTIHADEFEEMIISKMSEKISTLTISPKKQDGEDEVFNLIQQTEIQIQKIQDDIDSLVSKIPDANETTMNYINQKIKQLDLEKRNCENRLEGIKSGNEKPKQFQELKNAMTLWDKLDFDDKRSVVELLIEKILVYPDKIEIKWNV